MDEIVRFVDNNVLKIVVPGLDYLSSSPGSLARQILAIYYILIVGGLALYFILAGIAYVLFFKVYKDKYHPDSEPQPLPGQIWMEIDMSLRATPIMATLTFPFFLGEINGYSKLYDNISDYGWTYYIFSLILFVFWSDTLIYWIHRELHEIPWFYKHLHKQHHLWKVPTPFASIAFHPVDGWMQSLPYHLFPYIFPMHKWTSVLAFAAVQIWSIFIHDGVHWAPFEFINGSAHHTFHHLKFAFNYGQYFTFWDRLCGTHMNPFWIYDQTIRRWVPTTFTAKGWPLNTSLAHIAGR